MPPPSFSEDFMSSWGQWVLLYGLPRHPERLERGESVPLARWVGTSRAAVLFALWQWADQQKSEDLLSYEVYCYCRHGKAWEEHPASGGGSHWLDPPLTRPQLAGDFVRLGMIGLSTDGLCRIGRTIGLAGTNARVIRLTSLTIRDENPVESDLGLFVVSFDPDAYTTIEVLDDNDRALFRQLVPPV